jgi:hypothetical protein
MVAFLISRTLSIHNFIAFCEEMSKIGGDEKSVTSALVTPNWKPVGNITTALNLRTFEKYSTGEVLVIRALH